MFSLRFTFDYEKQGTMQWIGLDVIFILIHILDVAINLNTVLITKEDKIKEKRSEILKNYPKTVLVRDIIGILFMILIISLSK